MHTILILVAVIAAYATGVSLTSKRAGVVHPLEGILVAVAVVSALLLQSTHRFPAYLSACAGAMLIAGLAVGFVKRSAESHLSGGTREFEDRRSVREPGLWKRWLAFSRSVADYQFRTILLAAYIVLIGPVAIAFRIFGRRDTLPLADSAWVKKAETPTLEAARRSF